MDYFYDTYYSYIFKYENKYEYKYGCITYDIKFSTLIQIEINYLNDVKTNFSWLLKMKKLKKKDKKVEKNEGIKKWNSKTLQYWTYDKELYHKNK